MASVHDLLNQFRSLLTGSLQEIQDNKHRFRTINLYRGTSIVC